jgi:hypothetical protein
MRWRLVTGLLLTLGSLAMGGLAIYLVTSAHDAEDRAASSWDRADLLCIQSLDEIGDVTRPANRIEFRGTLEPGEDWRVALMNASSVISYCSTRQMSYFCMGRGCEFDQSRAVVLDDMSDQTPVVASTEAMRTEPVKIQFHLIEVR